MADTQRSREKAGGAIAALAGERDTRTTASYRGREKGLEKEDLSLALLVPQGNERSGADEEGQPSGHPFNEGLYVVPDSPSPHDKYNAADSAREAFVRELLNAPIVFNRSVFTSEAAQRHVLSVINQLQLTARLYESAAREAEASHAVTKKAWEVERNRADLANVELRALRNELMDLTQLHVERCLSRGATSSDRHAPEMLMMMGGATLLDVRKSYTPMRVLTEERNERRISTPLTPVPDPRRTENSPPDLGIKHKERNANCSADKEFEKEKPRSCYCRCCENHVRAPTNERADSFSKSPQQRVAADTTSVPPAHVSPTAGCTHSYRCSDRLVLPACTFCNKTQTPKASQRVYPSFSILPIHSFSAVAQSFCCPLCAKVYPQMKALESHMRKRHGVDSVAGAKEGRGVEAQRVRVGKQEEVMEWLRGERLPPDPHNADGHRKYTSPSRSPHVVSSEAMQSFAEEVKAMRTTVGRLFEEGGIAARTSANEGHGAPRDRDEVAAGVGTTTATVDLLQQAMAMLRAQQVQLDALVAERSEQSRQREKTDHKAKGKNASRPGTLPTGDAATSDTTFTKATRGASGEKGSRRLSVSAHNKLFSPVVASPEANVRETSAVVKKTISKSTRASERLENFKNESTTSDRSATRGTNPAHIVVSASKVEMPPQPERTGDEMYVSEKRKAKQSGTERAAQSPSSKGKDRLVHTNTLESAAGNFLSKQSAFSVGELKEEDAVPPPLHETTAHPLPPAPSATLNMWEGPPATIQHSRKDVEGMGLVYSPNDRHRSRMVYEEKEKEAESRTPFIARHYPGGSHNDRIDDVHRPLFSSASREEENIIAQQRLESARGIVDKVATLIDLMPAMDHKDSDDEAGVA